MSTTTIITGDSFEILKNRAEANRFHAIVTDPPYGLSPRKTNVHKMLGAWLGNANHAVSGAGYAGHTWDAFIPQPNLWRRCFDALRPGGHALVFASSRTVDLMALSLRLAGFEIRDQLQWLYGTGLPKSAAISKAIAKAYPDEPFDEWRTWRSTLKPGHEPIILARKPLKMTGAECAVRHGTGALNVGERRISANVVCSDVNAEAHAYRHFYHAKTCTAEREFGLKGEVTTHSSRRNPARAKTSGRRNIHPTVKPIALMRWLCRLVCPPGGVILDPFAGSGSTIVAAMLDGFGAVGIEKDATYASIARARVEAYRPLVGLDDAGVQSALRGKGSPSS